MWKEVGEVARGEESGRESGDGKVRLSWPGEGLVICGFILIAVVKVQVLCDAVSMGIGFLNPVSPTGHPLSTKSLLRLNRNIQRAKCKILVADPMRYYEYLASIGS